MTRVKGATFDLDDTLWCGRSVIRRASAEFHAFLDARAPAVAAAFPPPAFNHLLGRFQRELPDRAHDYTFLRKHALRHCAAFVGETEIPPEDVDAFVDEAFDAFIVARSRPEFFVGVEDMLAELERELRRARGGPDADDVRDEPEGPLNATALMGVITNGNCLVELLPAFFHRHMGFVISAESVGQPKPAPEIFSAAVGLFPSTIARQELVHVGDHYDYDIVGAKAAGFRTIWINAEWPKDDVHRREDLDTDDAKRFGAADAILKDVRHVAVVIRAWNGILSDQSSSCPCHKPL